MNRVEKKMNIDLNAVKRVHKAYREYLTNLRRNKSDKRKLLSISVVHEFENIVHVSQEFIYGYFRQSEHIQSNILT